MELLLCYHFRNQDENYTASFAFSIWDFLEVLNMTGKIKYNLWHVRAEDEGYEPTTTVYNLHISAVS